MGVERKPSQACLGSCECLGHFLIGAQTFGSSASSPLLTWSQRESWRLPVYLSISPFAHSLSTCYRVNPTWPSKACFLVIVWTSPQSRGGIQMSEDVLGTRVLAHTYSPSTQEAEAD